MARVATPVSIVTTVSKGRPYGTTVSAFTSLSMEPPMVLVSLDRNSDTLAGILRARRFGLNILGAHQTAIAAYSPERAERRSLRTPPGTLADDLPRIPESSGWIACTVADLVDGGDHMIALGLVDAADLCEAPPLVYHARTFGTHAPH